VAVHVNKTKDTPYSKHVGRGVGLQQANAKCTALESQEDLKKLHMHYRTSVTCTHVYKSNVWLLPGSHVEQWGEVLIWTPTQLWNTFICPLYTRDLPEASLCPECFKEIALT